MDKGPLDSSKQSCQTHTQIHGVAGHHWWLDPKGPKDHESSTGFNEETQHTIEHYWKSTKKRNSSNNKRKRLQGTTAQRKMLHRLVELNDRMKFSSGLGFLYGITFIENDCDAKQYRFSWQTRRITTRSYIFNGNWPLFGWVFVAMDIVAVYVDNALGAADALSVHPKTIFPWMLQFFFIIETGQYCVCL